ncbi:hypothetical protein RYH73_07540 [Olivibacter sp. CPCC 100613]|uniref:hypothetical protein n=1 Tax=Olivibacter sp. CPCC 100613 TaxID=3079931 RepID=UPI002FF74271
MKHHGEIIERAIRRNGYSITDLSRTINVNRRSMYNWFSQPKLKREIILKIGKALNFDFSLEFPELFNSEDFHTDSASVSTVQEDSVIQSDSVAYWKEKYIQILEEYNRVLKEISTAKVNRPASRNKAFKTRPFL